MEKEIKIAIFIIQLLIILVLVIYFVRVQSKIKLLREEKEELEETVSEQKQIISYMERTLPIELYQRLEKKEGEQTKFAPTFLNSVVMDMNTQNFTEQIHSMQAKEIFMFINHMLTKTVPFVYEKKGGINKFYEAGFTAFFDNQYENAVTAAITISELIYEEAEQSELFEKFSIGLSYGSVLAGLAGTEERYSMITVSEYAGVSSFLQSIARKYDSRILITGTLRGKIENFEQKFHARKIGYIYITANQSLEEIYDIFDGDPIAVRNNKKKTKIVFEKGVSYYAEQDYQKARQYFIEVFKTNRLDRAAKEYLNRCEQNLADGKQEECKVQIETY